jgi:hypothetical protein
LLQLPLVPSVQIRSRGGGAELEFNFFEYAASFENTPCPRPIAAMSGMGNLSSFVRRIRAENGQSRDRSDDRAQSSPSSVDKTFVWSANCDFSQYVAPLSCEFCLHITV